MRVPDGTAAILEVVFMATGDIASEEELEAFFAGLQPTWVWLNELHTFSRAVYDKAQGRIGRFPRRADGGCLWPGLWADMNAPIVETWQHVAITSGEWRRGRDYFRQPGGTDPGAENLPNLDPDYYARQIRRTPPHELDRKVHNKFGRRMDGEPVHKYDDERMTAIGGLEPIRELPLDVGIDGGGSPAAILMQRRLDGQLRVLDEVVMPHGSGAASLGQALGRLLDTPRYATFRGQGRIRGWIDPSALYGADRTAGELDYRARVAAEAEIIIDAAPTQDPQVRRQAIDDVMVIEGDVPMFLLSDRCRVVRRGLMGGYHWRKLKIADADRYAPEPEKNDFSHACEGLQYGALARGGYERAKGRERTEGNAVAAMLQQRGMTPGSSGPRLSRQERLARRRGQLPQPVEIIGD